MAITVMGAGTKTTTEDVNLDPQKQFWSFLGTFTPDETGENSRIKLAGFEVAQTDPVGMTVQVGGQGTDSAIMTLGGRKYLLSTDGTPETVTIETAPSANSRIDAIVSYLDFSEPDASTETAGTPEYVKTIAVAGTVASSPVAPTDTEIQEALPTVADGQYIVWGYVTVGTDVTQITDSEIESTTAGEVVKSHNIDFTTLKTPFSSMPLATTSQKLPYSLSSGTIYRYGDLCFFFPSLRFTYSNPAGGTASETVPEGFRPVTEITATGSSGIDGSASMQISLLPNGTITYWTHDSVSSLILNFAFVYITNDDFPS